MISISNYIAHKLQLQEVQVKNTLALLNEGATIPFISRYRKERTGSLDEVQIAAIQELNDKLNELNKRKATILASIEEQGKLTDTLRQQIDQTLSLTELEDLYLPYKPKRRTRATIAREKGLEPLATLLWLQNNINPEQAAAPFVKNEVATSEEALQGARDIMAEWINENEQARDKVRTIFSRTATITSRVVKGKEEAGANYSHYFDVEESLKRCSSHRLLAMRRAEKEGILRVSLQPDEALCTEHLDRLFVKGKNAASHQVELAIDDSFKRLLKPSIENELAAESKKMADREAIRVFAENLRQLLLAPPLGQKRVLAIDPGFRTGCKVVCLDEQGNLLHHSAIYPHPPINKSAEAAAAIQQLIATYGSEAIAIGNGTAGRETELFIQNNLNGTIPVVMVSENGASVYSASAIAREEFPEQDVTVRGAISIGRRLIDPLSELVKIDPKSIGVGQYQHDVDQSELKKALDQTVISCVNSVGVQLNSASRYLLTYVSGLGPQLAQNIVDYRTDNGAFRSRKELMKVAKMGAKTFEQAAGFLRIANAENPLDNTAVHPENYSVVMQIAKNLGCNIHELIEKKELQKQINIDRYVSESVGLPTLHDIMNELTQPGRDPRKELSVPRFDSTIQSINDLKIGMVLNGIVTNITNFGAFVDIGIHENGLVHLSNMANRFVRSPSEVVAMHQQVTVKVIDIDLERKRIQLSMKEIPSH
jgi:uncharacterized protein